MFWIEALSIVVVSAVISAYSRYYLHMMQLESYQTDGYMRWLNRNRDKLMGWTLNLGVLATIAQFLLMLFLNMLFGDVWSRIISNLLVLAAFVAVAWRLNLVQYKTPEKKPFKMTPRMTRLYAALALVALLGCMFLNSMGVPVYLMFVGVPYLALVAAWIMSPVEKGINRHYLEDARNKLQSMPELVKIGITGSYGKTSCKVILAGILCEKYRVYATAQSINTPMGLTRAIREKLNDTHQIFIAEMGARHEGDIKELCDFIHPQYGVITSVGEQHLETFGDIQTVAKTKNELIDSLPKDGAAFFGADGGWCDELYERCPVEKYRAGLTGGFLSMYAEDIKVGSHGSSFTLADAEGGRVFCRTKLLGRHNIQNIALCAMVARRLGLTLEEISHGIARVKPIEHRLQLLDGASGITIIDDAFNSNPVGAKAALDVLSQFDARRVIVTPGMVEQGEKEEKLNRLFGNQIASSCDIAILVGHKHSRPILEGAVEAGMPQDRITTVANLDEAQGVLAQITRQGDVILFENDLPDNYSE
ncbi:MAG: UDP-N-acetylmuramoyl-tripeptide--D-alanyl-D-alanine ligase [Clostridia bacterium]|nr:UDP-N-acetylmuramoyl-tripeptide--D-alanyl-D-alanine ligase [Clostridia bacterium]